MQVKICGITNVEDALVAARCGADYVGLILAPSPRRVTIETAAAVVRALPDSARPVLVFRDAAIDEVLGACGATGAGHVQLHGGEPPEYMAELLVRRPQLRIIRAWEVVRGRAAGQRPVPQRAGARTAVLPSPSGLPGYLEACAALGAGLHAVLLDAPKTGPHPGFDVLGAVSRACPPAVPVWCAGRLTPQNVAETISMGRYAGVDVASGVEVQPGIKDPALVEAFIRAAKSAPGNKRGDTPRSMSGSRVNPDAHPNPPPFKGGVGGG